MLGMSYFVARIDRFDLEKAKQVKACDAKLQGLRILAEVLASQLPKERCYA